VALNHDQDASRKTRIERTVTVGSPCSSGIVLVVDDAPANLTLLERMLTTVGYAVSTATNGNDALETVFSIHPDLILMDVRMPGLEQGGCRCHVGPSAVRAA